jgi:hypothetical protein
MEEQGPFDRILQSEPIRYRDRAATAIVVIGVALGLLLLILVLPPISIFDDGEETVDIGPVTATIADELPSPPEGFEAVSGLLELSAQEPVHRPARLTVNLSAQVSEGEELSLFTYDDGRWRRLAEATVVDEGRAAQGEVLSLPSNIAVFRPLEQTRVVLGSLPPGAEPAPQALETLTTLNPTGFRPEPDGGVAGGEIDLPANPGVDVAPTISAPSDAVVEALNGILASPELRDAHVQAILEFAGENDFDGIDLDYRIFDSSLRDEFVTFVRDLSAGLASDGRSLTLTLPVPVREAEGWDTQGFDWEALTPLASYVKLGLEPEQDRYYQRMEEALSYLVPRVGSSKLLLTVSALSHERGADGVGAMTLTEALALASEPATDPEGPVAPGSTVQAVGANLVTEAQASGLHWDDTARAVVFTYPGRGGERTVWLANVFSEAFKLDLAHRYQLGGVAMDNVSRETEDANIWPAVAAYAETGRVELVKPNGELLQPRWIASGGALEDEVGPAVIWRAPDQAGTYTLTLIVSDGVMRVGQELEVSVAEAAGATAP